jgi:hypothetical protein
LTGLGGVRNVRVTEQNDKRLEALARATRMIDQHSYSKLIATTAFTRPAATASERNSQNLAQL